jgi:hypothetical protein
LSRRLLGSPLLLTCGVLLIGCGSTDELMPTLSAGESELSFVQSDTPGIETALPSCPGLPPAGTSTPICGPLGTLPDSTSVRMICWSDTERPGKEYASPRWFFVEVQGGNPLSGQLAGSTRSSSAIKIRTLRLARPRSFNKTRSCRPSARAPVRSRRNVRHEWWNAHFPLVVLHAWGYV